MVKIFARFARNSLNFLRGGVSGGLASAGQRYSVEAPQEKTHSCARSSQQPADFFPAVPVHPDMDAPRTGISLGSALPRMVACHGGATPQEGVSVFGLQHSALIA
jgi:hypothetical protein